MTRTLIATTATCMFVAASLPGSTVAQDQLEYSGCVTPMERVVKIAEGSAPSAACNARESEAHWTIDDPSGPETVESTDLIAGVSLRTQQLEPGVRLVLDDGIQDLASTDRGGWATNRIVAGHDGSVWVFSDRGFRRLGDEVVEERYMPWHAWASDMGDRPHSADIEVGPDGTVWWASHQEGRGHLLAYDGEEWTVRKRAGTGRVRELDIDDSGTLWASWTNGATRTLSVGYLDESDSWRRVGAWRKSPGWSFVPGLSAAGDGEVWILLEPPEGMAVWHLADADSKEWEPLPEPETWGSFRGVPHATSDGTMWIQYQKRKIVYFDGDDWVVFDPSDGVPKLVGWRTIPQAAPDGSFWVPVFIPVPGEERCDGVANFDGVAWSNYLQGSCIDSMDVAPDGTLWVRAREPGGPSEVFAIRPVEA